MTNAGNGPPRRVVIAGGGGFALEVLDLIESINAIGAQRFVVVGFTDSGAYEPGGSSLRVAGVPYLGEDPQLAGASGIEGFVVAIGAPEIRKRVSYIYESMGLEAVRLIHPSATVSPRSVIGQGSIICAGACLSPNAILGRYVHVNPHATVGHEASLGDFVSINPAAVVSGNVTVLSESMVGAGSVILQGLRLGERTTVGASACVTKDVPAGSVVIGVPASAMRPRLPRE